MALPPVVQAFLGQRVFTLEEAYRRFPSTAHASLKVTLTRLTSSGYLVRPRRGLYVVADLERPGRIPPVDPVFVAQKALPHSVAAYQTALEIHGAARSSSDVVWLKVPRTARPFSVGPVDVRLVQVPAEESREGVAQVVRDLGPVRVTNKERTLLDALLHPERCGGASEAFESLANFEYFDWTELRRLIDMHHPPGLLARLGFVLTTNHTKWKVPEPLLVWLRHHTPKYPTYFGREARGGLHDAEWNLVVPRDLLADEGEGAT